jgi:NNMT/PNMT/TEMT family
MSKQDNKVVDAVNAAESPTYEAIQQVVINPRTYLSQYYEGDINLGNKALLQFYAQIYEDLGGRSVLEFSGGPTIYSLITAARTAGWIHFCDYNLECLNEVNKWLIEDDSAFDWGCCTKYALSCEKRSREQVSEENIQIRHQLIRQRLRKISRCDIFADDPLLGSSIGPYGVVASAFCLDCITEDKNEWFRFNQKLANLVEKDGLFVTVSLLNASYWTIHDRRYPAVTLTPGDIASMYSELGFNITHSDMINNVDEAGYDGFIMTCGRRC